MATIKFHVVWPKINFLNYSVFFFFFLLSICRNSRIFTFHKHSGLISNNFCYFLTFSNKNEKSKMAGQITSPHMASPKMVSSCKVQGHLINLNLFRCALTERNPKEGFYQHRPAPGTTVGALVSLYVRVLKSVCLDT